MLARMNIVTFVTGPTDAPTIPTGNTVREAKPRAKSVDRNKLRKEAMKRYQKTLAYLAK